MQTEQSYLSYFTPSQMSHEMLEAILVQRHALAERLVDKVAQSVLTEAKHQTLLLGPRGMGKSYLLALVYHRIKARTELNEKIAIAYFAEEEWGVGSLTDLFLVILKALEREHGGLSDRIEALYDLPVPDVECAARNLILEFVGERTLFLLIENLDEIFRGLGPQGQWAFRSFLSERPFVTILATTPSLFDEIAKQKAAFFGFFQHIYLKELTVEEATELLGKVSEKRDDATLTAFLKTPVAKSRVQAVHDLAGGHPRIYLLFAHLLTQETLDELVTPFMKLLDELTPYYQSRMQLLSPQQRKIIEYLCTARGAVKVKEIATQNLISQQTTSSQLQKLEEMAYVRKTQVGRASYYELREPLLRMVIEMKRGRGEPIRLIVDFLRRWYDRQERRNRLDSLTDNFPLTRKYLQYSLDWETAKCDSPQWNLVRELLREYRKYRDANQMDQACNMAEEIIEKMGHATDSSAWAVYAFSLRECGRCSEALDTWNKSVNLNSEDADIIIHCGITQFILAYAKRGILVIKNELRTAIENAIIPNFQLQELGQHSIETISVILKPEIPQAFADTWLTTWEEACGSCDEFKIPLRLLRTAVEWKRTKSMEVLLTLPIEERSILQSMLPSEENQELP